MPLRALEGDKSIHAFDLSPDEWRNLKNDYRGRGLVVPCCSVPAVPKNSPKGLQFFAHKARGECISGPETMQHVLGKMVIAKAAQQSGWSAMTERGGLCADGRRWIADVFCSKGKAKVAFEVQWSPQTAEVTRERHSLYTSSGVRAAWLFQRLPDEFRYPRDKGIPAFQMSFDKETNAFEVYNWWIESSVDYRGKDGRKQKVSLEHFTREALSGGLEWRDVSNKTIPTEIIYCRAKCTECRTDIEVPRWFSVRIDKLYPDRKALSILPNERPEALDQIEQMIQLARKRQPDLCTLKFEPPQARTRFRRGRFDGKRAASFVAQCPKCRAIQPDRKDEAVYNKNHFVDYPGHPSDRVWFNPHWYIRSAETDEFSRFSHLYSG